MLIYPSKSLSITLKASLKEKFLFFIQSNIPFIILYSQSKESLLIILFTPFPSKTLEVKTSLNYCYEISPIFSVSILANNFSLRGYEISLSLSIF